MKAFIIQSPCYRANGLNGNYYSIAFSDEKGNVIRGFGDHISPNSYGVRNVYDAEGTPFSDEDRFISIKEVALSEESFDAWLSDYQAKLDARESWYKALNEVTEGNAYEFLYQCGVENEDKNRNIYDDWMKNNPAPEEPDYYSFLRLVKNE